MVRPNDSHIVNMVQAASGKNVATYEMMVSARGGRYCKHGRGRQCENLPGNIVKVPAEDMEKCKYGTGLASQCSEQWRYGIGQPMCYCICRPHRQKSLQQMWLWDRPEQETAVILVKASENELILGHVGLGPAGRRNIVKTLPAA